MSDQILNRSVSSCTLATLNELRLLDRLVLPSPEADPAEDARVLDCLRTNASLGLLRFAVSVEPDGSGWPCVVRRPDEATGRLLARIFADEGGVMPVFRTLPDGERTRIWQYAFPVEECSPYA